MKIIIEDSSDIIALDTIYYFLQREGRNGDRFNQEVFSLWIEYIHNIQVEVVGANYAMRKAKKRFDFPFDKDYGERFLKSKTKKNGPNK